MSVESRLSSVEERAKQLDRCVFGNGQPGLEDKFKREITLLEGKLQGHIERVERHTNKNMEQGDGDILGELKEEREAREKQHEENTKAREKDKEEAKVERKEMGKKIDRLTMVQAGISGAFVFYKVAQDLGWLHIAGVPSK